MVNGFFNLPIPSLPLRVTFTIAFVCSQLDSLIILFPLSVLPHPCFYSLDYSLSISACSSMLRCVQVLTYLWSYKSILWFDFLAHNIYPGQSIPWFRYSVLYIPTEARPDRDDVVIMLWIRIRNVLFSNLGWDTGFHDWNFWWFCQSIHANDRIIQQLGHNYFLPNPFLFIIQQSYHSMLCIIDWNTMQQDFTVRN